MATISIAPEGHINGDGPITRSVVDDPTLTITGTVIPNDNIGNVTPADDITTQYENCNKTNCNTCDAFKQGCKPQTDIQLNIGCPITTCPYHSDEVTFPIVKLGT